MRLEKAVVIGGSIGGMLAARVIADHFESWGLWARLSPTR